MILLNSYPPAAISLSYNPPVYVNIRPNPQYLPFVSTIFIKTNSMEDAHHLINAIKK